MPVDQETISRRLDELIQLAKSRNQGCIDEAISGTISILESIYGVTSEKTKSYIQLYRDYARNLMKGRSVAGDRMRPATFGVLKSIKSEVKAGLVGDLKHKAQGRVLDDFVTLARESLDESKNVAAVLICAVLEDALKRFALQNSLDVAEADMAQVINALKSKRVLKDPQASIIQGYVKLRNKAFHAQWDKIEKESVNSAIGFTEQFLIKNFA